MGQCARHGHTMTRDGIDDATFTAQEQQHTMEEVTLTHTTEGWLPMLLVWRRSQHM